MFTVYIINHNLLEWPKKLVHDILKLDKLDDVFFVDNASTYPPLLEWYKTECPSKVVHLPHNCGHRAPWNQGVIRETCKSPYFVVTDPDLDIEAVPTDVFNKLKWGLDHFGTYKAGLSLEIYDIPEDYPVAQTAKDWEAGYWAKERLVDGFYMSPVDTTFSLYRAASNYDWGYSIDGVRADRPYTARHMPFYLTKENAQPDFINYLQVCDRVAASGSSVYRKILGIP